MSSANEREFNAFGIAKGFRGGILTFFLALLTAAIVSLFFLVIKLYGDNAKIAEDRRMEEARLYQKMIDDIAPARDKMNNAAQKVIESSSELDSLMHATKIQPK